jgi:redox-sensitive bicupin YhaK (pirin superfamily)
VTPPRPSPEAPAVRFVVGKARVTQTEGIRGRTLFPSPDFSHWPPFERFAETWAVGTEIADPHPHAREEVVIYALSGSLRVYDEARHATEVPPGSVTALAAVQKQVHDVNPKRGTKAHWLAIVLRLPPDTPEPRVPLQTAAAVPEDRSRSGLKELRLVGDGGPVRSTIGLDLRHLLFEKSTEAHVPVAPQRTALVYVLAGQARVANQRLSAGSGFLGEGVPDLSISGAPATRLIWASVPSSTG